MKKYFAILLITAMAVMMVACGKDKNKDNASKNETDAPIVENRGDCSFTIDGNKIVPGEDFASVKDALGEPVEYYEGASCYYDGMDKVFTYDGFEISTYPQGDKDIILSVQMSTDKYSTDKGITVGSTLDAVKAAYGDDFKTVGNNYKYYFDDKKNMYFMILNDAVKFFGFAIEQ